MIFLAELAFKSDRLLEKFLRSKIDNRSKRIRMAAPSVNGGYRVQHSK